MSDKELLRLYREVMKNYAPPRRDWCKRNIYRPWYVPSTREETKAFAHQLRTELEKDIYDPGEKNQLRQKLKKCLLRLAGRDPWWEYTRGKNRVPVHLRDAYGVKRAVCDILELLEEQPEPKQRREIK
jgi:hypothetical protein